MDAQLKFGNLSMLAYALETCSSNSGPQQQSMKSYYLPEALINLIDHDLLFLLDHQFVATWRAANFHTEPNPAEVFKAHVPLQSVIKRILHLLERFPGNEVLQQICTVATTLSNYYINATSLGKMLGSLHYLMRKMQEWEDIASKEVSLREEFSMLSQLVITWRSVELQSWSELLRSKEQSFIMRALSHFPRLTSILSIDAEENVTIDEYVQHCLENEFVMKGMERGVPSWMKINQTFLNFGSIAEETKEMKHESLSSDRKAVFDSLDQFLRSAVVGEFSTRLHLVRLFALRLEQKAQVMIISSSFSKASSTVADIPHVQTLSNLLYGLWRFYEQFARTVEQFKEGMHRPVQQKIQEEIKISRWDHMSVYGLLENSDKVHRKLVRLIKEYEKETLETPVSVIMHKVLQGNLVSNDGNLDSTDMVPSNQVMFPIITVGRGEKDEMGHKKSTSGDAPQEIRVIALLKVSLLEEGEEELSAIRKHLSSKSNIKNCLRLDNLCIKASVYLQKSFIIVDEGKHREDNEREAGSELDRFDGKTRFGLECAEMAEDLSYAILDRIEGLREPSSSKVMKHRALLDLFDELKAHGISHLKAHSPLQLRQISELFGVQSPLSLEVMADLTFSTAKPSNLFEKAESYFFRNTSEIQQLRFQVILHDIFSSLKYLSFHFLCYARPLA